jgi:hypothetical protein
VHSILPHLSPQLYSLHSTHKALQALGRGSFKTSSRWASAAARGVQNRFGENQLKTGMPKSPAVLFNQA